MEQQHGNDHDQGHDEHAHDGSSAAPGTEPTPPPPTMGSHGMLLLGDDTLFLSHLPMFMFGPKAHPHNFQVILGVTLPDAAHAVYQRDRREHPNTRIYTFVPDDFEMEHLDPTDRKIESLRGPIHRGHFERHSQDGGGVIGTAEATITDVIMFRAFQRGARQPDQLEYLLFGGGESLFLAHVITAAPDFDQILSVRVIGQELTHAQLAQGVPISVPGRPNRAPERLKAGEHVQAQIRRPGSSPASNIELIVDAESYFEEGELGLPFNPDQTPEEASAGF